MPVVCDCGSVFTVEYALSCPRGAISTICHNEISDMTANLLTEVCHNVMAELNLQPLTGEAMFRLTSNKADGARVDITVNGFWGDRFERKFLNVRVFNPYAPTRRKFSISNCYRKHEEKKECSYEQRILKVERWTFTPLVFSATGEMAKQCLTVFKGLASCLADKWKHPYSLTPMLATMLPVILPA